MHKIPFLLLALVCLVSCVGEKVDCYELEGVPLRFSEYVYLDSCDSPAGSEAGRMNVNFRIGYVYGDADSEVAMAINREIVAYEFGQEYKDSTLAAAVAACVTTSKEEFFSIWEDDFLEDMQANYEHNKSSSFVKGQGGVLCYESYDYIYEAGAHGVYGNWVLNFDYTTGRLLSYADVFEPSKEAHVRQLIQQCLIADLKSEGLLDVESVQDLKANGYMFEENLLPSTRVFRLGEDGITFIYGIYSIAPYALGETVVTVPYDMIEGFIQKDVLDLLAL